MINEKEICTKIAYLPFNEAFNYFLSIKDSLTDDTYWLLLRALWIQDGNCSQLWKNLFFNSGRKREHKIMKSSDRQALKKLPNTFFIYRGCNSLEEEKNFNWTTDINVIDRFNKKYIAKKAINKKEVFAYFNSRQEAEIILKQ